MHPARCAVLDVGRAVADGRERRSLPQIGQAHRVVRVSDLGNAAALGEDDAQQADGAGGDQGEAGDLEGVHHCVSLRSASAAISRAIAAGMGSPSFSRRPIMKLCR